MHLLRRRKTFCRKPLQRRPLWSTRATVSTANTRQFARVGQLQRKALANLARGWATYSCYFFGEAKPMEMGHSASSPTDFRPRYSCVSLAHEEHTPCQPSRTIPESIFRSIRHCSNRWIGSWRSAPEIARSSSKIYSRSGSIRSRPAGSLMRRDAGRIREQCETRPLDKRNLKTMAGRRCSSGDRTPRGSPQPLLEDQHDGCDEK